jgi:hypothetical protein
MTNTPEAGEQEPAPQQTGTQDTPVAPDRGNQPESADEHAAEHVPAPTDEDADPAHLVQPLDPETLEPTPDPG